MPVKKLRVIIAGTRTLDFRHVDMEKVMAACGFNVREVVSGCAPGADRIGEIWAEKHGIPVKFFPADWDAFGKAAGPKRNAEMADYGDALVAIWNGDSAGTENMIATMNAKKKPVYVHRFDAPVSLPPF